MEWFRTYHGISSDSKWPLIARKSGQNIGTVVAVWMALLDHASQDDERGSVAGFDCEEIDALYGYEDGTTQSVVTAMEAKGMIVEGCVKSWDKRQPKANDEGSDTAMSARERKQLSRARARIEELESRNVTECHGESRNVTECHGESRNVTECHGESRNVTTDKRREEKNINTPPPSPSVPAGGCDGGELSPLSAGEYGYDDAPEDAAICDPWDGDMDFQEFIEAYPPTGREPRGEAFAAWKSLAKKRKMPGMDALMAGLSAWQRSEQWTKDGGQFVPKAAKFLRYTMWKTPPVQTGSSGVRLLVGSGAVPLDAESERRRLELGEALRKANREAQNARR